MRIQLARIFLAVIVWIASSGIAPVAPAWGAAPASLSASQPASAGASDSPSAVGLYAISLPGNPPPPPGGLDTSGWVEVPYSAALNPSGGALTIEGWVKRSTTARSETLLGNGWQHSYWLGFSPSGQLRFTPDGYAHHLDSAAVVPAGAWTHVAAVFSSATTSLYINGALDATASQPGAVLLAASGSPVVNIGFDRDNTFSPNYFSGVIDELRLWRAARTPDQIRDGRFTYVGGPAAKLLAEWRFNGNANDSTGAHNGVLKGFSASFTNEGALPKDLLVPLTGGAISLDGFCGSSEYGNAAVVSTGGTSINVLHTATDLWVCLDNLGGTNTALVYLDPQHDRSDPAGPQHLRLSIDHNSARSSAIGDAAGNWVITSTLNTAWSAAYASSGGEFPSYSAEFRIPAATLGGLDHVIGLAMATDTGLRGGFSSWPAGMVHNLPSTWSSATLAGAGTARSFSGTVAYIPQRFAGPDTPVGGVPVSLIGYTPGSGEALVAQDLSAFDGSFSLSSTSAYPQYRIELGSPPRGLLYSSAHAGAGGTAVDNRTIDFGAASAGAHSGNLFRLTDAVPFIVDTGHGPVLLIVAPQAVFDSGALQDFEVYKSRLGFAIEEASLESIDAGSPGANRQERIRNYEIARRNALGSRFQYVLLIGLQTTIPSIKMGAGLTGKSGATCAALKANGKEAGYKYSDWMYVDLVSNFDSNGNGCYGDGLWTDPSKLASGYVPDFGIFFIKSVALGRIPFDDPTIVRYVLKNSMDFERQSLPYKTKALFSMSALALEGYRQDGTPCSDNWSDRCVAPSGDNFDMSQLAEMMKLTILLPMGYTSTSFYENENPIAGGTGINSPQMISQANLTAALNAQPYGLVNFDGHGNGGGVYRVIWPGDLNHNGVMNLHSDPNLNEVAGGAQFTTSDMANLTKRDGKGGLFYSMACLNADPDTKDNFAATVLSGGHGVASIAALSVVGVGSFTFPFITNGLAQQDNYYAVQRILAENQRLGDALWGGLSQRLLLQSNGSGQLATTLFGDPSLDYLGDPGGGARLAAWSMIRREPNGQAYFTLPGPELPKKLWQYPSAAPAPANPLPSPVVSASGEVIVAAGNAVQVLRNGVLFQNLALDAQAYGTPAVAADGTIYTSDVNGKLYAFTYPADSPSGNAGQMRQLRWGDALGGAPQTSPVIAPDGSILIANDASFGLSQMNVVRPDGLRQQYYTLFGKAQQAASAGADRSVYVATDATTGGLIYRLQPYCDAAQGGCGTVVNGLGAGISGAPLLAYGKLYVGLSDGRLFSLDPQNLQTIDVTNLHSRITAGPVSGPGGQVLVGTEGGMLYSLTQSLGQRWSVNLGAGIHAVPAFSDSGLYLALGNLLYALNTNSGAALWKKSLASAGDGSVAVGYGRQIYVQTSSGKVFAFGEGWTPPVFNLGVIAKALAGRPINVVNWELTALALAATPAPAANPAADTAVAAPSAGTPTALLLQRSANGAEWSDVGLLPPGTTVFTDTNITASTPYQYRLQVIASDGQNSDFTISPEQQQSNPNAPGAPVLASVTADSATTLHLAWNAPGGAAVDNYRIERAAASGGPYSPLATVGGATTESFDKSLAPSGTAYYRVVALNASGESAPSNNLGGTTFSQGLPAPTGLKAVLGSDGVVTVTWGGRPGGAQAVLEVLPFGSSDWLPLANPAVDSFAYSPGEPNGYAYRIKFVQGTDESAYAVTTIGVTVAENHRLYSPLIVH